MRGRPALGGAGHNGEAAHGRDARDGEVDPLAGAEGEGRREPDRPQPDAPHGGGLGPEVCDGGGTPLGRGGGVPGASEAPDMAGVVGAKAATGPKRRQRKQRATSIKACAKKCPNLRNHVKVVTLGDIIWSLKHTSE